MDCIMSVCGDDMYFRMAEYSIPSFIENNIGSTLHVVTDKPWKISSIHDKVVCYDYETASNGCDDLERIKGNSSFDNNGKRHSHDFVSLLPLIANNLINAKWICKIDCDSYFKGNLFKDVDECIANCDEELILADRTRTDLMKPYWSCDVPSVSIPGAGLVVWRKDGRFVEEYIRHFDGNEQSTIQFIYQNKIVKCDVMVWPGVHWVYPFTWYEQNGAKFTKEVADMFIPFYIHVGGSNQLEQLKTLKGWYE